MANRVDILVTAKNAASAQLKKVQTDLQGVNDSVSRLSSGPGLVGALFGIGGVTALAAGAVELTKTAAQFKTLENAFQSLAARSGESGDKMLSAMRDASGGMISDAKLVESANRAMMLGVADSADEMAKLLQVAQARGQAMGLSAEQAFSDLVTGIGRMSPLILDNLGIITGGQKVFDDYAASIGKAADELTDAEKKHALFAQVVRDSQADIATMTEAGDADFQRLKASIDNAKVAIGQLFGADVIAAAGNLSTTIDKAVETLERLKTAGDGNVDPYAQSWMGVAEAASQAGQAMTAAQSASIASLADYDAKLMASRQNVETLTTAEEQLSATTQRLGNDFISVTGGLSHFNANLQTTAGNVLTLTSVMAGINGQINSIASGMVSNLGAEGALGYAEDLTDEARTMAYQWMQAGVPLEQIQGILLPGMLSDVRKTNAEIYSTAKGVTSVNSEFNTLKNTISSIVSGATGPVAGVNAEDFLPREDEVNENARRLADIMVNGVKDQPWLDEFKNEVPGIWKEIESSGDPQGTAARILKDFQDGLRPELIDKGKAKDLARRALIGDKNTKALVDEIAGELAAEMGVSFAEAQAAASSAFGGGGSSGGGSTTQGIKLTPTIDTSGLKSVVADSDLGALISEGVTITPMVGNPSSENLANVRTFTTETLAVVVTPQIANPDATNIQVIGMGITDKLYAGMSDTTGLPQITIPYGTFTIPTNQGMTLVQGLVGQMTTAVTGGESGTSPLAPLGVTIATKLMDSVRGGFVTAQTSSGDSMMGQLGSMWAGMFTLSIAESSIGADVAGAIHQQIAASVSLIETSGTNAGQNWRKGFMSEVMQIPGDTLRTLAMLVTPYVIASVNSEGGRTGAESE